jgi:hypothetical protein
VIKADIKRVLDRMQVQHREIRGGFECIHVPSIDLSSLSTALAGEEPRRSVVRKGSRLSFGKKSDREEKKPIPPPPVPTEEKKLALDEKKPEEKDKEGPPSRSSLSFTPKPSDGRTTPTGPASGAVSPTAPSPNRTKFLPPIPRDFVDKQGAGGAGVEAPEDVWENGTTNELCVRFEISIVKVSATRMASSTDADRETGPAVTTPWYSVPSRRRRRMAIPDARKTGANRVEAVNIYPPF